MAILAYDDVMLREPSLLVPNQQPIGPVRVDWANPLSRDLIFFYEANAGVDVVSRSFGGGTKTIRQGMAGRAGVLISRTLLPKTAVDLYQLTVAIPFVSNVEYTTYARFLSEDAGGPNFYHEYSAQIQGGVSGSVRAWSVASPSGKGVLIYVINVAADTCSAYLNNSPVSVTANGSAQAYFKYYAAGNFATYAPNPRCFCIGGYVVWKRQLSLGEVAAITADPFALLIPA